MQNNFVTYPEIGKIYQHYKGGKYEVLTLAKNTETDEILVIYKSLHFGSVYARPLSLWFENVSTSNDKIIPRFKLEL